MLKAPSFNTPFNTPSFNNPFNTPIVHLIQKLLWCKFSCVFVWSEDYGCHAPNLIGTESWKKLLDNCDSEAARTSCGCATPPKRQNLLLCGRVSKLGSPQITPHPSNHPFVWGKNNLENASFWDVLVFGGILAQMASVCLLGDSCLPVPGFWFLLMPFEQIFQLWKSHSGTLKHSKTIKKIFWVGGFKVF